MRKKTSSFGILCVLLLSMAGCTTPSQWKADALVDELCAKDGGIKVYETVTLPKERFNEYGQFTGISFGENANPTNEYYRETKTKNISNNVGGAFVSQDSTLIYRRSDHKLLGEKIIYARQGGDIFAIDMPSAYICNQWKNIDLDKQVFLKSNN
jgi:hypothetical protein